MSNNIVQLPKAHPLVARHATTPEQMRALVRDLALWMYDHGVENVALARTPGTAKIMVTVDGSPI